MKNFLELALTGKRISLVPINMDFSKEICENFTPEVGKFMWPSTPKTQSEINSRIDSRIKEMSIGQSISLMIVNKKSKEFLGYVDINQLNTDTPELGIWLKKSAHGNHFGFESLSLLINWAQGEIVHRYFKYPVDKRNIPSRKLAESLGGKIEAEYKKLSESGVLLDEVEYRFHFVIKKSQNCDVDSMNRLSRQKRTEYEKAQPRFWKWAGEDNEKYQKEWFEEIISNDKYICMTAEKSNEVIGFIIGEISPAPQVYNPGGLTLIIDDFCVLNNKWDMVGEVLLREIKSIANKKNIKQIVVVSGYHDFAKNDFLKKNQLSPASIWHVGDI